MCDRMLMVFGPGISRARSIILVAILSQMLSGCPETSSISTENETAPSRTTKSGATTTDPAGSNSTTTSTTTGAFGPAGPKGEPGTPAPAAFGADATALAGTVYVRPNQTVYTESGYTGSTEAIPMTVIGGNTDIRLPTQKGIYSILHVNAATSYRGHDAGGAITMGRLDNPFASTGPSMMTRIATGLDIGNSHGSRLRLQTTKSATGWNDGLTLWEDGSASLGYSWVDALASPGASLTVKGVSSLPLMNLAAQSDGASKVFVSSAGKMGIGTAEPEAAFHLTTGAVAETTCNSWSSYCFTVPSPIDDSRS